MTAKLPPPPTPPRDPEAYPDKIHVYLDASPYRYRVRPGHGEGDWSVWIGGAEKYVHISLLEEKVRQARAEAFEESLSILRCNASRANAIDEIEALMEQS